MLTQVGTMIIYSMLTCSGLCIDAFLPGHPPIIPFRHVQILINLSSTASSECASPFNFIQDENNLDF
jgi:hypothetical protein